MAEKSVGAYAAEVLGTDRFLSHHYLRIRRGRAGGATRVRDWRKGGGGRGGPGRGEGRTRPCLLLSMFMMVRDMLTARLRPCGCGARGGHASVRAGAGAEQRKDRAWREWGGGGRSETRCIPQ